MVKVIQVINRLKSKQKLRNKKYRKNLSQENKNKNKNVSLK